MTQAVGSTTLNFSKPLRIHLLGIGGAGMSAIAIVLDGLGHQVSGSDAMSSPVLDTLREAGIAVRVGHSNELVDSVDLVGSSTAIPPTNPELLAYQASGVPCVGRFELLSAIGERADVLSLSGTHGKTTTSALLTLMLQGAGEQPNCIVGAKVAGLGTGALWTGGTWLVLEADESDSTFLAPRRRGAVVTNLEPDHLDHHGSFEALRSSFVRFVNETEGPVLVCHDDEGARGLIGECPNALTYGFAGTDLSSEDSVPNGSVPNGFAGTDLSSEDSVPNGSVPNGSVPNGSVPDYRIERLEQSASGSRWDLIGPHGDRSKLQIAVPGLHLVRNASGAFALGVELGLDPVGLAAGLAEYRGVHRRFEHRAASHGVTFIDDYAHLPTEIAAVLQAAALPRVEGSPDGSWSRIVAVFQPHRYSRTQEHAREFGSSFDQADLMVFTDIYPAGEAPIEGVTGELIAAAARDRYGSDAVLWCPKLDDVVEQVGGLLRPGDLCITLGAGDLTNAVERIVLQYEHLADIEPATPRDAP